VYTSGRLASSAVSKCFSSRGVPAVRKKAIRSRCGVGQQLVDARFEALLAASCGRFGRDRVTQSIPLSSIRLRSPGTVSVHLEPSPFTWNLNNPTQPNPTRFTWNLNNQNLNNQPNLNPR